MIIGGSSETVAGGEVGDGDGEEAERDRDHHDIEHGQVSMALAGTMRANAVVEFDLS
jgi:hypothetical protein